MSFTVKVKEADEGTSFDELVLSHADCGGGFITTEKIEATIGKNYKTPKPKNLLKLECSGCYQKVWIPIQSGGTAEIMKTAVDGQDRTIDVLGAKLESAEFRDLNRLIEDKKIELEIVQISGNNN